MVRTRNANDGIEYTREEFVAWYGPLWYKMWRAANQPPSGPAPEWTEAHSEASQAPSEHSQPASNSLTPSPEHRNATPDRIPISDSNAIPDSNATPDSILVSDSIPAVEWEPYQDDISEWFWHTSGDAEGAPPLWTRHIEAIDWECYRSPTSGRVWMYHPGTGRWYWRVWSEYFF